MKWGKMHYYLLLYITSSFLRPRPEAMKADDENEPPHRHREGRYPGEHLFV